ncbi:MAG: peptide chain release factor N(5)-glutamine methyltransferase [Mediterraneibacter sp.]
MTLKTGYTEAKKLLEESGIEEASLDAWLLLEHVTGISRASYYADPDREMSPDEWRIYSELVGRRAERVPLQHITGTQEFMGLVFEVNEHVLIPRQDTEILVEQALAFIGSGKVPAAENSRTRILDMCTGSGCILLSVMHWAESYRQKALRRAGDTARGVEKQDIIIEGTGADISPKALAVAEKNARRLGISAGFVESDLFGAVRGKYGMIVSNPPYIRTDEIKDLQEEVRLHDPVIALDGREDGLYYYRRIVRESRSYLEEGGALLFEIGCDQAEAVSGLMSGAGFSEITVKKDLAGLDRVVSGVLK